MDSLFLSPGCLRLLPLSAQSAFSDSPPPFPECITSMSALTVMLLWNGANSIRYYICFLSHSCADGVSRLASEKISTQAFSRFFKHLSFEALRGCGVGPPPFSAVTELSRTDSFSAAQSWETYCKELVKCIQIKITLQSCIEQMTTYEKQQWQRLVFPGLLIS